MSATYTMQPDDFDDGCFVRTDAITGRSIGSGINRLGVKVTLPLGVPLCSTCDEEWPEDARECPHCSETLESDGTCAVGCDLSRRVA